MRIEPIKTKINPTFQHSSSDYYIKTGRFLNIKEVKKTIFNFNEPWYKKVLNRIKVYLCKAFEIET